MMFKIKCSNWLKFNGTQIDYGRELCFVIVVQITTVFIVLIIFFLLDRHWESLENYWKNNPITYSLYGSLLTILNKVIPTLAQLSCLLFGYIRYRQTKKLQKARNNENIDTSHNAKRPSYISYFDPIVENLSSTTFATVV